MPHHPRKGYFQGKHTRPSPFSLVLRSPLEIVELQSNSSKKKDDEEERDLTSNFINGF